MLICKERDVVYKHGPHSIQRRHSIVHLDVYTVSLLTQRRRINWLILTLDLKIALTVVNLKYLPGPVSSSTSTRRYFAVAAPISAKTNNEKCFIVEKIKEIMCVVF